MLEPRVPWDMLREAWALRDSRYRDRRVLLNDDEADAVRAWRGVEVERVPGEQRGRAYSELQTWRRPEPPPPGGRRRRVA